METRAVAGLDAVLVGMIGRALRNDDFSELMLARSDDIADLDDFGEGDRHNFLVGCWFTTSFLLGLLALALSPRLPPAGIADTVGVILTLLLTLTLAMALVHGVAGRVYALHRVWDNNVMFGTACIVSAALILAAFYS